MYLAGDPCLLMIGEAHEELVGCLSLFAVLAGEEVVVFDDVVGGEGGVVGGHQGKLAWVECY